jgi:Ca2+-transporting ATPase
MASESPPAEAEKIDWHLLKVDEVLKKLNSRKEGLEDAEVKKARAKYGENALAEGKKEPKIIKFLRQFTDVLVIVLLIAAIITAVLQEFIDAAVIAVIVIVNALIGYFQEEKAEEAIARLKKMASPKSIVFRNGKRKEVEAAELVPGDVIHVESGMRIPADARVFECFSLKVNESALTGESVAEDKSAGALSGDIPLADRTNMLYMATTVEVGRGTAVVTETGMSTEMGKIAHMLQESERIETPLQKRLKKLGKWLGFLVLGVCAIIFALEIFRAYPELGMAHMVELFETSVSLAVAAIPEGLPAMVTVALAIGLKIMAKKNVIVRKLPVVETLGSATVICTDKTGTLTTGTMTADILFVGHEEYDITGTGYGPEGQVLKGGKPIDVVKESGTLKHIMNAAALCGDATLSEDGGHWSVIGDTTEGAVMVMAKKAGFDYREIRKKYPRLDEIPFDADRKMMSTLHEIDGIKRAYTKGAPERVLQVCNEEFVNGGEEVLLTEERKKEFIALTEKMAKSGYRTLGFATDEVGGMEKDMTFLGIVGIHDKVRLEAKDAVKTAKKAGIRVIMITGDHRLTATAIGKEIGLIEHDDQAMNCRALDDMDEKQFIKTLDTVSVYARASPEHKVRIVTGLKDQGHIAAMTGDGVNDAPALKRADIGVAMGITGTDVTKEAADMIITDDNFASIVSAVEEGRAIYDNIRKVIQFLLSCNMGEVLVMFIAILLGWPLPLIALQILWMNLVTDSLPAFALIKEPKEKDLMNRKPRNPKESAITKDMMVSIGVSAAIITLGTLILFYVNHEYLGKDIATARTVALTTMVFFQMWTAIACRSTTHSMMEIGWFSNPLLMGAIVVAALLMLPVIYVPFIQDIFGTAALGGMEWIQILGLSVFGLLAVEIWEFINRKFFHLGVGG